VRELLGPSLVVLAAAAAAPALADDTKTPAPQPAPAPAPAPTPQTAPPPIQPPIEPPGSSDDLDDEIAKMRPRQAGILPYGPVSVFDSVLDDFNRQVEDATGLRFGAAFTSAYQHASRGEHRDAAGHDIDVFARWRFFGDEKAPTRGILGVYGEERHEWGEQPPKDLASQFDPLWRTTNGFSRQQWMMTQAWWEQHFANDEIVATVGKIDADNFYNKYRYQSDSTAFMSQAFSSNPARGHPGNGLGFNVTAKVPKDYYVSVGAQDANGEKRTSGFHSIDEGDLFTAGEIGWTPTIKDLGKGAYRLSAWHIDEADVLGNPKDYGVGLSCEQEVYTSYVPFFRASWSDGDLTGVSRFVAAGMGFEGVVLGKNDLTAVGLAWGDPTNSHYRDQLGGEAFHRFQLAPDVQFTVGVQYFHDPSKAPSSNHEPVAVLEFRLRIAF
jgi:hypothetical protein